MKGYIHWAVHVANLKRMKVRKLAQDMGDSIKGPFPGSLRNFPTNDPFEFIKLMNSQKPGRKLTRWS